MRGSVYILIPFVCLLAAAQTPAPAPASHVIGAVTAADAAGHRLELKTDQGQTLTIALEDRTLYLRVPPGEKDLKKAARVTAAEIGVGDRVLARGRMSEDQKTLTALSVIVMTKSDLAQRQQQEHEEWQRRGVAGTVEALDPAAHTFTLAVRGPEGKHDLVVDTTSNPQFRRYAPDSVKFADARPGSFGDLQVGDQVRALGDKSADGTHFKPEIVVSGSFRNIAAVVKSVNAPAGELTIQDLDSKKILAVHVTKDSNLRKLPPMMAMMLARRVNPDFAGGAGQGMARPEGSRFQGGPAGGPRPGAANGQWQGRPGGSGGAGAPGGGAARNGDLQQFLERMPALELAELKPGDALIIGGTNGADPLTVTAITVIAGVDPLFRAAPDRSNLGGQWNFGGEMGGMGEQ